METYSMMTTCGASFEGFAIREYLGFVSGDVLARNAIPCVIDTEFPEESPVFGTPHLERGDRIAVRRMEDMASQIPGANAICNVSVTHTVLSPTSGSVLVMAIGTAVHVEAIEEPVKEVPLAEEKASPDAGETLRAESSPAAEEEAPAEVEAEEAEEAPAEQAEAAAEEETPAEVEAEETPAEEAEAEEAEGEIPQEEAAEEAEAVEAEDAGEAKIELPPIEEIPLVEVELPEDIPPTEGAESAAEEEAPTEEAEAEAVEEVPAKEEPAQGQYPGFKPLTGPVTRLDFAPLAVPGSKEEYTVTLEEGTPVFADDLTINLEQEAQDLSKTIAPGSAYLQDLPGQGSPLIEFVGRPGREKTEEARQTYIERPRWCPNCHAGVEPDMLFCHMCGTPLRSIHDKL